jgi:hypothetical protein
VVIFPAAGKIPRLPPLPDGTGLAVTSPEVVMTGRQLLKKAGSGLVVSAAIASAGYAALVVLNRVRYGDAKGLADSPKDSLLDRFIPKPEVVEHHQIAIAAPADVVMATAKELELLKSPIIRAIIRAREIALGGEPDTRPHPTALIEQMQSIGWVVLDERPGREIALGSVTQPWHANPTFRSIAPDDFAAFSEPGYVKIAWTLRADPIDDGRSTFHTETRVSTTDSEARDRFRSYWSFVAPGVELIRVAMLRPLKRAAEAQPRASANHAAA